MTSKAAFHIVVLGFAAFVTACDSPPLTLAQLPHPQLYLYLSRDDAQMGPGVHLQAQIYYGDTPDFCGTVYGLAGHFNGDALEVTSKGAKVVADPNDDDSETSCSFPTLTLTRDRLEPGTLEITDGLNRWTAELDNVAPGTASYASSSTTVRPGDSLSFTLDADAASAVSYEILFGVGSTPGLWVSSFEAPPSPLSVTVPDNAESGAGDLILEWSFQPEDIACRGPERCSLYRDGSTHFPLTVAPSAAQETASRSTGAR